MANVIKRSNNGGITAPRGPRIGVGQGHGVFDNGGTTAPGPRAPGVGGAQALRGPTRGGVPKRGVAPGAAGAAPQGGPALPWDIQAANSEAGALKREQNTLTGLGAQWELTAQQYGLEGPYADYAQNPYSRASLLQRSYDNSRKGTLNSAGNQLYAGSYVNKQNSNTRNFNLGRNELEGEYARLKSQNVAERAQAEDDYREAQSNAGWERINAGLQVPLEKAPIIKAKKKAKGKK